MEQIFPCCNLQQSLTATLGDVMVFSVYVFFGTYDPLFTMLLEMNKRGLIDSGENIVIFTEMTPVNMFDEKVSHMRFFKCKQSIARTLQSVTLFFNVAYRLLAQLAICLTS